VRRRSGSNRYRRSRSSRSFLACLTIISAASGPGGSSPNIFIVAGWCEYPLSQTATGRRLKNVTYRDERSHGTRYWGGMTISGEGVELLNSNP
jgi:hypothetical protein